jgi:hypothetical protein
MMMHDIFNAETHEMRVLVDAANLRRRPDAAVSV